MDYRVLAAKKDPFEGLSEYEAKKLIVYFGYFVTPPMSDEEIFVRYGFSLPHGSMSIIESIQLIPEVLQDLTHY